MTKSYINIKLIIGHLTPPVREVYNTEQKSALKVLGFGIGVLNVIFHISHQEAL